MDREVMIRETVEKQPKPRPRRWALMIIIIMALFVILFVIKIIDAVTQPLCVAACPAIKWRHRRPRTGDLIFFHMPRKGLDMVTEFIVDSATSQPVGHSAMVICLGGRDGDGDDATSQVFVASAVKGQVWRMDPLRAFAKFTTGAILMPLEPALSPLKVMRALDKGKAMSPVGVVLSTVQSYLKLKVTLPRTDEICSSKFVQVLEELGVASSRRIRGSILPNDLMLAHDPDRSPLLMTAPYRFSPPVLLDSELNIVHDS